MDVKEGGRAKDEAVLSGTASFLRFTPSAFSSRLRSGGVNARAALSWLDRIPVPAWVQPQQHHPSASPRGSPRLPHLPIGAWLRIDSIPEPFPGPGTQLPPSAPRETNLLSLARLTQPLPPPGPRTRKAPMLRAFPIFTCFSSFYFQIHHLSSLPEISKSKTLEGKGKTNKQTAKWPALLQSPQAQDPPENHNRPAIQL